MEEFGPKPVVDCGDLATEIFALQHVSCAEIFFDERSDSRTSLLNHFSRLYLFLQSPLRPIQIFTRKSTSRIDRTHLMFVWKNRESHDVSRSVDASMERDAPGIPRSIIERHAGKREHDEIL